MTEEERSELDDVYSPAQKINMYVSNLKGRVPHAMTDAKKEIKAAKTGDMADEAFFLDLATHLKRFKDKIGKANRASEKIMKAFRPKNVEKTTQADLKKLLKKNTPTFDPVHVLGSNIVKYIERTGKVSDNRVDRNKNIVSLITNLGDFEENYERLTRAMRRI